jgi:hypothetical protein
VRLVFLAAAAAGVWVLLRRRRADDRRVVVGWADGSELELQDAAPRERLLAIADGVLR